MKRLIKFVIILAIILLLLFGVYKYFIDRNKFDTYFDKEFVLNVMDSAIVEDEVLVKLLRIEDVRCKKDDCLGKGEIRYKVLVINDNKIKYISLGTVANTSIKLEKINYKITLVEGREKDATFKLQKLVKKK